MTLFNSVFETALRILLLMDIAEVAPCSVERLAALDFMTTYSSAFNYLGENLHGNSPFRFSEYATRRASVKKAVKWLLLNGFSELHSNPTGLLISLTDEGHLLANKFSSEYADLYHRQIVSITKDTTNMTDEDLLRFIGSRSTSMQD